MLRGTDGKSNDVFSFNFEREEEYFYSLITSHRISQVSKIERFLIECRKTKTKAMTTANHNKRTQHNEPMRTRNKYI